MPTLDLPPSPVWLKEQIPAKFRPLAFAPIALGLAIAVLFLVGLAGADIEWAILAGILAGPAIAYAAVGPPFTREQVAKLRAKVPRTPPHRRPLLFFPAAVIGAALLYFAIGFLVTAAPLDEDTLALLALGLAVPAAIGIAYLAYGFPRPKGKLRDVRNPFTAIPVDRRPLLFFPLGLLIAAPLYFVLGYGLTEALISDQPAKAALLDAEVIVLVALAACLAIGFWAAARLVGTPKTGAVRSAIRKVPEVPARARPPAFVAFVFLVGSLLALALGGTVGSLDLFASDLVLDLAFPLFLLGGWLLAVPVAGRLFGYPVPDRPLREYVPHLAAEQRPAALLPLALGLGLALTFVLGTVLGMLPLAGGNLEDVALAAMIAFPLGLLVAMRLLRVEAGTIDPRSLASVPESAKPLAVVALALMAASLLFVIVSEVLASFLLAAPVSLAGGIAIAIVLVDQPFLAEMRRRRSDRHRQEREIEARLRAELGLAEPPRAEASEGGRLTRRRTRGKA